MNDRLDWSHWLQRWDAQQEGYLSAREDRFNVMLDVLAALLPEKFLVVDLASGPGSISQRILKRFPEANCIAVDLDPVLIALGKGALGDQGGRLHWVQADIQERIWVDQIGVEQVDAVLTTTALHWLPVERLVQLYRQLGRLVRPGGVVLNGDHMPFPPHMETFQKLTTKVTDIREAEAFTTRGVEDWDSWWTALEQVPGLEDLFAERQKLFSWRENAWSTPILELQEAALREAGFQEVGVIWQNMDNRVLMALR